MKPGTLFRAKKRLYFFPKTIEVEQCFMFLEEREAKNTFTDLWFLAPDGTKVYYSTSSTVNFWKINISTNNCFEEVIL